MKTKYPFLVFFITISLLSTGQNGDTIRNVNTQIITDQLENLAQNTDINLDYNDLIDDYLQLAANPVNINSDKITILRDLYLINDNQLANLLDYQKEFGPLFSIYELTAISGFSDETIVNLRPFVKFGQPIKNEVVSPTKIAKYGQHQLIFRYDRVLEKRKGYILPTDSAVDYPGSVYLGDPAHYYIRYAFNYKNKIRVGFTLDKDAGEPMFKNKLSDSINQLVGDKINSVFDFLSVFGYAEDIGFIKKIVVGDYHLEFGQGLTLWSGLSFGKSAEAINLTRYGKGIRPNTSANENRFFRGAATTIAYNNIWLTAFYSSNKIDGNLEISDTLNQEITSIIETGFHRTINELLDKETLKTNVYGGNVQYRGNLFHVGFTGYHTEIDIPVSISNEAYKLFRFSGNNNSNIGADFNINLSKLSIFGELAFSSNGGIAFLSGVNAFLNDRFTLTVFYHNYEKEYQNLYCNPFAETSAISNENGIYIGLNTLISKAVTFSAYLDYFTFPWPKYQVDGPSYGQDISLQLNITPSPKCYGYIKARFKNSLENYNNQWYYLPEIQNAKRNEFKFFISYEVTDFLTFKNRADIVFYSDKESKSNGYMLYHDALLRNNNFPIDLTFRLALFSTESYDSRIYVYENDVLYAFSVPAYFDSGLRWYIMLKWKIMKNISLWARYSAITFFDQKSIGSGNDVIEGNRRSDVKLQLIVNL